MNLKKLIAAAAAVVMTASAMAASVSAGVITDSETGIVTWAVSDEALESGATEGTLSDLAIHLGGGNDYLYGDGTNNTVEKVLVHWNGANNSKSWNRYITYTPSVPGILRVTTNNLVKFNDGKTGNGNITLYAGNTSAGTFSTGGTQSVALLANQKGQIVAGTGGADITKIEFIPTATKIYAFEISDWSEKSAIYVEASKGGSSDTKSISLSELPHVTGDVIIGIAVQITDVPADVNINSVYVQ